MKHFKPHFILSLIIAFFVFNFFLAQTNAFNVFAQTDPFNTHLINNSSWGCNPGGAWQIPVQTNLFLGRTMQDFANSADSCSGKNLALAIGTMDWASDTLAFTRKILTPPVSIPEGKTITTAYDPSVVYYNNEYWVAFECYGNGFTGSVGTCMGPLNINGGIDTSRTYVVINGNSYNNDGLYYSASVPGLFVYQGKIYLYWIAVKMKSTAPNDWVNITSRGIELEQEQGPLKRLWPKGVNGLIQSNDPRSVEVLGLGKDNRSNLTAGVFQVFTEGDYIYAFFERSGDGDSTPGSRDYCLTPWGTSSGCYRLSISRTTVPLGEHIFNQNVLPDELLPSNVTQYTRYWVRPDGAHQITAEFGDPKPGREDANSIPTGGLRYILLPNGIASYFLSGDLNSDGKVDIYDYNIIVRDFGHPYTIIDYNQLVGNFGK